MTAQNQPQKVQAEKKSQRKAEVPSVEFGEDLAGLERLPGGPMLAFGGGSAENQARRLGDMRLQGAQRRALAARIGKVQGNVHLQRVVAWLVREPILMRERDAGSFAIGVQRIVEDDITRMSITEDWARALSDHELDEQINMVREQLLTVDTSTAESDVAYRNLEVLYDELGRRSDPRRQLAQKILADVRRRGGITVAVYVTQRATVRGRREFRSQARQYARDHRAIGMGGGTVGEGVAMELTSSLPSLFQSLDIGIESLLAEFPELAEETSVEVPVQTLAIFTHGTRRGLQAGEHARWIRRTLAAWVEGIAPFLAPSPLVLLYACSTAGQPPTGLPFAEELRLALQAELEELHGTEAGVAPVVWGHSTVGHVTANRFLVEFGGGALSASSDLLTELGRRMAALAIEHVERAGTALTLNAAQRARLERRAKQAVQRVVRARTGRLDPTNAYIREVPLMGADRVWRDLSSRTTPDYSDLDLVPDAAARVARGLLEFRGRFAGELARLETHVSSL